MSRRILILSLLVVIAACGLPGGFAQAAPGYPGNRLSPDDQRRFDSYYSRWLEYKRTNNLGEVRSMEKRMYDVYSKYRIPANLPFERVATNGRPPGIYPPPGRPPGLPGWGQGRPPVRVPAFIRTQTSVPIIFACAWEVDIPTCHPASTIAPRR